MKRKPKPRTRTQIVDDFKHQLSQETPKRSLAKWAEDEGYNKRLVYAVTEGIHKCTFGKGREIAEKIGLLELEGEVA